VSFPKKKLETQQERLFKMVDTRSIRQKGKKMGVTFWTFGVDHYELEESTVQYGKKCKSPKF
jgi:hypothetical protein